MVNLSVFPEECKFPNFRKWAKFWLLFVIQRFQSLSFQNCWRCFEETLRFFQFISNIVGSLAVAYEFCLSTVGTKKVIMEIKVFWKRKYCTVYYTILHFLFYLKKDEYIIINYTYLFTDREDLPVLLGVEPLKTAT